MNQEGFDPTTVYYDYCKLDFSPDGFCLSFMNLSPGEIVNGERKIVKRINIMVNPAQAKTINERLTNDIRMYEMIFGKIYTCPIEIEDK
jgi:hypothetical protein